MSNAQMKKWNDLTEKLAQACEGLTYRVNAAPLDCSGDEARAEAYEAASEAYRACYEGYPSGAPAQARGDYRWMADRYAKRARDLREIIRRGL